MADTDPKWLVVARKEIGTKEMPGPKSNPRVVQYYVGAVGKKFADAVPWCAAFLGWTLGQVNIRGTGSLMARSYTKYGTKCPPKPGAIVVFPRGGSPIYGHVTFVESVAGNKLVCVGGNQSDAVTRAVYDKRKAIAFRWPPT